MNLYTAVLFVHAIAVLVLTAALTMEAWMLLQLRQTATPSEFQPWTGVAPSIAIAVIGSLIIIYVTGAWLAESLRSWRRWLASFQRAQMRQRIASPLCKYRQLRQ